MSTAVSPATVEFKLRVTPRLPAMITSPSMVVPCTRVKALLSSPSTEMEEPVTVVAALPAVVVMVSSVMGAKKVLPPSTMIPALPAPGPVSEMAPRFNKPVLLTILPARGVHLDADRAGGVLVGDAAFVGEKVVRVDGHRGRRGFDLDPAAGLNRDVAVRGGVQRGLAVVGDGGVSAGGEHQRRSQQRCRGGGKHQAVLQNPNLFKCWSRSRDESPFNCLAWQTLDLAPAFRIAAWLAPPWSARASSPARLCTQAPRPRSTANFHVLIRC